MKKTNIKDPQPNSDKLAVAMTGCNMEKMLSIIKILADTGEAQAYATFK